PAHPLLRLRAPRPGLVRGGGRLVSDERFLATGAFGCIGTWGVRDLVRDGVGVTALDLGAEPARWPLAMSDDEIGRVRRRQGDITDLEQVERVLDEDGITHVIHLAALQVPFCRADPPLGARVNVLGTVNVFEAVKRRAERVAAVVYASSIAAYDALEEGGGSVGLRPHTVFGPGRDQGLTSAPTTAMLAAAAGEPYRIPFGGTSQFQY